MGRLLIFLAMVVVAVGVLGLMLQFFNTRRQRAAAGLQDSKDQIEALEARKSQQATALQEIHNLAETEITLATGTDASMWRVVQGLAAEALKEKKDTP
jgi:Tfp pilus assembly protein PilV